MVNPVTRYEVPAEQIPAPHQRRYLTCLGRTLALFNIDGQFYAIDDSCPHQGASLCGGRLDGKVIQCSAHGLRFDLRSGYLVNSNQVKVTCYPVEMTEGRVFIVLPEESVE